MFDGCPHILSKSTQESQQSAYMKICHDFYKLHTGMLNNVPVKSIEGGS